VGKKKGFLSNEVKSSLFSVLVVLISTCALGPVGAIDNAELCASNGFMSDSLSCSSCNSLAASGLSALEEECRSCCKDEDSGADSDTVKYPYAELVVCS